MKKRKVIFCIALVFVLSFGITSFAEAVTIDMLINHGVDDVVTFEEVVERFEEQHPDISVNLQNVSGEEYYDRLATRIASNTMPDVFYFRGGSGDHRFTHRGVLHSLDEAVKRDADEINIDDFIDSQIEELKFEGEWVALPYDYSSIAVYYNKEMFDEAGVDYPTNDWDWDDLIEKAKQLTKSNGGVTTQYGIGNTPLDFPANFMAGAVWTMGGEFFNEDYTQTYLDEPETIEAFRYLANIAREHEVAPSDVSNLAGNPFFTERAAMMLDGSWATMQYRARCDFPFEVVMMPKNPETGERTVAATGGSFAINENTDNFEAAWELVKFLVSPESLRTLIVEPIRSVPPRESLMDEWTENVAKGELPPQNSGIFAEQIVEYGRNVPPVHFDWFTVAGNRVGPLLDQQVDLEEQMQKMAEEVREAMREVGIDVEE